MAASALPPVSGASRPAVGSASSGLLVQESFGLEFTRYFIKTTCRELFLLSSILPFHVFIWEVEGKDSFYLDLTCGSGVCGEVTSCWLLGQHQPG